MAEQPDLQISCKGLQFIINHVFLPPKLPQQDDSNDQYERSLLDLVCQTLSTFQAKVAPEHRNIVQDVQQSMAQLAQLLDSSQALNGDLLQAAAANSLVKVNTEYLKGVN